MRRARPGTGSGTHRAVTPRRRAFPSSRIPRFMKYENSLTLISDEVSQDLPAVARFVREFGLRGFELRSMAGRAFKDLTDQDVAAVRAAAAGEGWRIHG